MKIQNRRPCEKGTDGFTLAHGDQGIRGFWIEHAKRCRKIGADIGRALGSTCVVDVWIPDGYKDLPVDRVAPRQRLLESLDASINRVAAWVIGIRAAQKALLLALLEPSKQLREAEAHGNLTARLALLEEAKSLPWGAVWDEFCRRHNVPVGPAWLSEAEAYGQETARLRSGGLRKL